MKELRFISRLNLTASGKVRRFSIVAYTGGLLRVDGFEFPVVVDLAGLQANASVPIILDHKPTTDTTVGQTSEIQNDGRRLVLKGPVTGQSKQVLDVLAQADKGYQWQASIGCSVESQQHVPGGGRVTVNCQSFTGPIIVARSSVLCETSVLPVGADSSTQVNLAAAAALKGNLKMTFSEWLESLGIDEAMMTPEGTAIMQKQFELIQAPAEAGVPANPAAAASVVLDLRASRAADFTRIAQIEALGTKHPHITAAGIANGWSPAETELHMLRASQRGPTPSNRMTGNGGGPDATQVLCASFALNAGGSQSFLAKQFGDTVVDAASRIEARGATIRTVMDHVLRAAGMHSPSNRITDAYIRAAFEASRKLEASAMSTVSLPGILGNSANKLMLEGFAMVKTTWQEFCAIGNLSDLKEATRYRMITGGEFEEVGPGGHIKHLNLTDEETYTNQAKTYASMLTLTRTSIINDDMGAFETLPKSIGRKGNVKLEKMVYTKLLSNAGDFFSSGNSNKLTGANSVLDIGALSDAEQLFLTSVDGNGDPIMITPEIMLLPPALSVTGNALVKDTQVVAIGVGNSAVVTPNGNPHAGKFAAIVTPWLQNANLTNYSALGWYLIARAQGSSGLMEVGFLNGQQSPTIETGELDFSQLGIALRGYWDFGVAFQDGRYGVFNVGA